MIPDSEFQTNGELTLYRSVLFLDTYDNRTGGCEPPVEFGKR